MKLVRLGTRALVVAFGSAAVLLTSASLATPVIATPVDAASSSNAEAQAETCRPWTVVQTRAVDGHDHQSNARAGDGRGRRYYLRSPHGLQATQTQPPDGWRPDRATAEELQEYGYPPRPADPSAQSKWQAAAASYRASGAPGYCEGTATNGTSGNWAGYLDNGKTYTSSYAQWRQTGFVQSCPSGSKYSTWAGLGGSNTRNLLQSGTDAGGSLNSVYAWWEAVGGPVSFQEQIFSGSSVPPGDVVQAGTNWNNTVGSVSMYVYDVTTGRFWSTGRMDTIAGYAARAWYDGTTSEYITEAPLGGSAPGGLYYLRQPTYKTTAFSDAKGNGVVSNNNPGFSINEVSPYTRHTMQLASPYSGPGQFTDTWQNCS